MRNKARQIILFMMVVDFPLLYLAADTPEATALTFVALAWMGVAAAAAGIVY